MCEKALKRVCVRACECGCVCVCVCLDKVSGQQGPGWGQGRGEGLPMGKEIMVFSFQQGGPVARHVTHCVGGGHGTDLPPRPPLSSSLFALSPPPSSLHVLSRPASPLSLMFCLCRFLS